MTRPAVVLLLLSSLFCCDPVKIEVTVCVSEFEYQGVTVRGEHVTQPPIPFVESDSKSSATSKGCYTFCAMHRDTTDLSCILPCTKAAGASASCHQERREPRGGDIRGL